MWEGPARSRRPRQSSENSWAQKTSRESLPGAGRSTCLGLVPAVCVLRASFLLLFVRFWWCLDLQSQKTGNSAQPSRWKPTKTSRRPPPFRRFSSIHPLLCRRTATTTMFRFPRLTTLGKRVVRTTRRHPRPVFQHRQSLPTTTSEHVVGRRRKKRFWPTFHAHYCRGSKKHPYRK